VPCFISVSLFTVAALQDICLPFYMTCVSLLVCYSALHIFNLVNWSFYWNSSSKSCQCFGKADNCWCL